MSRTATAAGEYRLCAVKDDEMKLLLRLRALQKGAHLAIIYVDNGLLGLTLLGSGKVERLRKGTGPPHEYGPVMATLIETVTPTEGG